MYALDLELDTLSGVAEVLMRAWTAEEEDALTGRMLEGARAVIDGEELCAPATSEHGQVGYLCMSHEWKSFQS